MKQKYVKPMIEKVDFKFTEHIAASPTTPTTPTYEGGQYNIDHSSYCNFRVVGCTQY